MRASDLQRADCCMPSSEPTSSCRLRVFRPTAEEIEIEQCGSEQRMSDLRYSAARSIQHFTAMTEPEAPAEAITAPLVEAVTLPKDPTPAISTSASSDAPPAVSDKPVAAVLDLQLVPQLVCVALPWQAQDDMQHC